MSDKHKIGQNIADHKFGSYIQIFRYYLAIPMVQVKIYPLYQLSSKLKIKIRLHIKWNQNHLDDLDRGHRNQP